MDASIEQHQSLPLPHQQQQQQSTHQQQGQQHVFFPQPHPGAGNHPHAANGWIMPPPLPMNGHEQHHDQQQQGHEQGFEQISQQQQSHLDGGGNGEGVVGADENGLEMDGDVDIDEGEDEDGHEGQDMPEMMMVEGQSTESKGPGPIRRSKRNGGAATASHIHRSTEGKVSLADLKDCPPGVKPYHAYSTLIRYAIKGSPSGKLLLEDIYEALMLRFDYFKTAPAGWKNSVRHNLSLNPMFVKVERPLTDRGKGFYWTVKDEEGMDARTGVHRNRKKKSTANTDAATGSQQPQIGDPLQYPQPPFVLGDDGSVAALQAAFNPYPRDQIIPDIGPDGEIDWQASWWNEITKLQQYTTAQENEKAGPEWYRWMFERMRAAFGHPAVIGTGTSTIHVNHLPPQQVGIPGVQPPQHVDGEPMAGTSSQIPAEHQQQQ
ncbi:hypothetical protein FRB94_001511 [Tulasnella sp. JGI-2019a]|nr:hypothetical protein FRB94_001511 [Tulasnella sp. JGI-2019a]KAG9007017.1 hypothetical protein FRB93_008284 [Tulasnella sp. JGI-2019a]KAG9034230.1 hypothetical protein FRB95_013511 [Tulasnella sp. JGI-2019a]